MPKGKAKGKGKKKSGKTKEKKPEAEVPELNPKEPYIDPIRDAVKA